MEIHQPTKTITQIKSIHLMEGAVHEANIGYGFSGLILETQDGRIVYHGTTDFMVPFTELKPEHENYEQIRALITHP